jgi:hypothetical protein
LVVVVQSPAMQTVPLAQRRQAPLPSQVPSVPQVEVSVMAQLFFGSAPPAPMNEHVPMPFKLHAAQRPQSLDVQQTPSVHLPDKQSPPPWHCAPLAFRPHDPGETLVLQTAGLWHCELPVQLCQHFVMS